MEKNKKEKIMELRVEIKKLLDEVDKKVGEINSLVYLDEGDING